MRNNQNYLKDVLTQNGELFEELRQMHFNTGITELFSEYGHPTAMFDPLPTIRVRIGTSSMPISMFLWKMLGYSELIGRVPGKIEHLTFNLIGRNSKVKS